MRRALLALTVASFGIGTTEFVVAGLLPNVADDLGITLGRAGGLIAGYALGVVIGGPAVVLAAVRLPRKTTLIGLLLLFIAGNALAAVAPNYGILMTGRVLSALCHGAFFGVASVVAGALVAADRQARAVAMVFAGLTLANVVGAPLGTAIGQGFGWRTTFVAVAALGVISLVGILAFVPAGTTAETTDVRTEISALRRPGVWLTMGIAACSIGAVFAMFTYIAPLLTEVAGYSQEWVAPVLVVFGLGLMAGNMIGGRFADRAQLRSIGIGNAVSTGALLLLAAGVTVPGLAPVALALCGAAAMATVPGFITRIIEQAKEAPVLGATLGASGANLGISVGAYLSGVAVEADLGLRAPAIVGASMAATGLALTLAAARAQRRTLANRPDAMAPA